MLERSLNQSFGPMNQRINYYAEWTENVTFGPDAAITSTETCVEDLALPDRGDIWPLLTPVSFDTVNQYWVVWDNTRSIDGFLIGKTGFSTNSYHGGRTGRLQLFAADQTKGLVMMRGELDASEVYLPPNGATQAELESALKDGPRRDGFKIRGLDGVHA